MSMTELYGLMVEYKRGGKNEWFGIL
jgi:hypothetical protein